MASNKENDANEEAEDASEGESLKEAKEKALNLFEQEERRASRKSERELPPRANPRPFSAV